MRPEGDTDYALQSLSCSDKRRPKGQFSDGAAGSSVPKYLHSSTTTPFAVALDVHLLEGRSRQWHIFAFTTFVLCHLSH